MLEIAAGPIAPDAVSAGGDIYLGSAAVPLQPQADGTFWIPRDLRVPFDPNVFLGVVGESGWRAKPQWHASSLLANGYAVLRVGRPLDRTPIGDYSTGAELAVILSEGMHVKGRQLLRSVKLSGGFRAELHLLDEDAGIRILDEDGRDLQLLESRRPQRSPPSDLSMVVRASADKVCLGDWVTLEINWAMQSRASPRAVSLGEGFVPLVLGAPTGVMCVATARVRMPFDGQPSPRVYVRGRGPSGPWSESRLSLEHVDVFGSVITDERGSRPLYPHDPLCLNDAVRDFRIVLPADLRRFWGTSAPLPVFLGNRIVGELVEERVLFHKRERLLPFGEILVVDRDIIGSSPHVISSQPIGSGEVTSCELSADARITRVCLRRPLRLDRLNCTYRTADGSLFDAPMGEKGNLCDVFDIDNSKQGAPIELVLFDAERVHGTWSFSNKEIPGEATGVDVCWSLATGLPLRGRRFAVQKRFKMPSQLIVESTLLALSNGPFRWPVTLDARIAWLQATTPLIVSQFETVAAAIADLEDEQQVQALLGFGCPILRTKRGSTSRDAYRDLMTLVDQMHSAITIDDVLAEYLKTAMWQPRVLSNPRLFVESAFAQITHSEVPARGD